MPRVVICIPESPAFTTTSEREVWERLRDQLGAHDVLIANQRLTTEDRDYEADLVVLMPDFGVLVLEVKGGSVWFDEGWRQQWVSTGSTNDGVRWIHPVQQAHDVKYALRTYVEGQPVWGSRTRVRWAHGVVTPYSSFPEDFSVPDLPRWALHDRGDQEHLVTRARANASKGDTQRSPTRDDVEAIGDILAGRGSDQRDHRTGPDVNAEALERAAIAARLTDEQSMILNVIRLVHRVEIRGGAGSGKTVLALQQARELSRKGQRTALLCYSIGLASFLERQVATWPRRQQPAFVGTFHDFGRQWGAPEGDREDSEFWEVRLPDLMSGLAEGLPDGKRYDAVVVDEAQDFAESWWTPVVKALRDEEAGGLYVFSDENQRIFGRFGRPPMQLVPLVLDHCLRNTKEIHGAFASLAPSRMYARGPSGPTVRYVSCAAADAEEVADDEVVRLLDDEGWEPGRVALITTGRRHTSQRMQVEEVGQDAYWETFWDGEEVFYGHVLGCKGLERAAVVLCLNEDSVTDRARERLYVGMSRATDELVVVGDPDWIREVGGPAVAKQLGL